MPTRYFKTPQGDVVEDRTSRGGGGYMPAPAPAPMPDLNALRAMLTRGSGGGQYQQQAPQRDPDRLELMKLLLGLQEGRAERKSRAEENEANRRSAETIAGVREGDPRIAQKVTEVSKALANEFLQRPEIQGAQFEDIGAQTAFQALMVSDPAAADLVRQTLERTGIDLVNTRYSGGVGGIARDTASDLASSALDMAGLGGMGLGPDTTGDKRRAAMQGLQTMIGPRRMGSVGAGGGGPPAQDQNVPASTPKAWVPSMAPGTSMTPEALLDLVLGRQQQLQGVGDLLPDEIGAILRQESGMRSPQGARARAKAMPRLYDQAQRAYEDTERGMLTKGFKVPEDDQPQATPEEGRAYLEQWRNPPHQATPEEGRAYLQAWRAHRAGQGPPPGEALGLRPPGPPSTASMGDPRSQDYVQQRFMAAGMPLPPSYRAQNPFPSVQDLMDQEAEEWLRRKTMRFGSQAMRPF